MLKTTDPLGMQFIAGKTPWSWTCKRVCWLGWSCNAWQECHFLVVVEISSMSTLNSLFLLKGNFVRGSTVNFNSRWLAVFLCSSFSLPDFPFLQVDTHTKPKWEKIWQTDCKMTDLSLVACNHVNVILMRKHIHRATPCILHNRMLKFSWICVLMFFSILHIAFLSIFTLVRQYTTLAAGLHRSFRSGGPSQRAAAPHTDSTAPSLSCSCFLHSTCQVYTCFYLCCPNPSKQGSLPFLNHGYGLLFRSYSLTVC